MTLRIDEARRISAARFKVIGCSWLVAACAAMSETVSGLSTADAAVWAQSLEVNAAQRLGEAPQAREHCAKLAGEALLSAVRNYSDALRTEWIGDEVLICSCFGVSERTIEEEVRTRQMSTIEEVTEACKAGAGCRSCYPLIQDILEEIRS